jgi:hypothetical protein
MSVSGPSARPADLSLVTLQAELLFFVVEVEVVAEVSVEGVYGAQVAGATATPLSGESSGAPPGEVRIVMVSLGTTGAFGSLVLQKTSVHADAP